MKASIIFHKFVQSCCTSCLLLRLAHSDLGHDRYAPCPCRTNHPDPSLVTDLVVQASLDLFLWCHAVVPCQLVSEAADQFVSEAVGGWLSEAAGRFVSEATSGWLSEAAGGLLSEAAGGLLSEAAG